MINGFGTSINFFSVKSYEEFCWLLLLCVHKSKTHILCWFNPQLQGLYVSTSAQFWGLIASSFFPAEVKSFSLSCKQNSSWKIIQFTQKWFPAFTFGEQKAVNSLKDLDWEREFWGESTAVLRLVSHIPLQWFVHTVWWVCAGLLCFPTLWFQFLNGWP